MKYTFFLLVYLLSSSYALLFAQGRVADIPIEKLKASECVAAKSPQGAVFLIFEEKKEFRIVELDATLQYKKQFLVSKPDVIRLGEYIGVIAADNSLTLFYSFRDNLLVRSFQIDCNTHVGTTSETLVSFSSKEKLMDAFEQDHVFYVLSMPKYSKVIHVYSYNAAISQFERTAFDFEKLAVPVNMYERYILNKKDPWGMGLHRVIPDIPHGLGNTCYRDKFYTFDNQIIFTSDLSRNTHIMILNLETKQPEYKTVSHEIPAGLGVSTNSVLYKDHLFQLAYTSDNFVVQIWDMQKNQLAKQFLTSKQDSIPFANTPIIQEKNTSSDFWGEHKNTRELSSTKQLLRKMVNSVGAISINSYTPTRLVMTIGSYKEITSNGGSMSMPMGGASTISTPGGMVQTGSYMSPMHISYGKSSLNKSAYFKSLLNTSSLEHTAGNTDKKSAFEKMQDEQEHLQMTTGASAETIFKHGESYIYGFYNKHIKTYTLMQFQ